MITNVEEKSVNTRRRGGGERSSERIAVVEDVLSLWNHVNSSREIAAIVNQKYPNLAKPVTKNTIVGIAHRERLSGRVVIRKALTKSCILAKRNLDHTKPDVLKSIVGKSLQAIRTEHIACVTLPSLFRERKTINRVTRPPMVFRPEPIDKTPDRKLRVHIYETERDGCKYIAGDTKLCCNVITTFTRCGDRSSYCTEHEALVRISGPYVKQKTAWR